MAWLISRCVSLVCAAPPARQGRQNCGIDALPPALLVEVLVCVPLRDRVRCAVVAKRWAALLSDAAFWSRLDFEGVTSPLLTDVLLLTLCRRAGGCLLSLDLTASACAGSLAAHPGFLRRFFDENMGAQLETLLVQPLPERCDSQPAPSLRFLTCALADKLAAACPRLRRFQLCGMWRPVARAMTALKCADGAGAGNAAVVHFHWGDIPSGYEEFADAFADALEACPLAALTITWHPRRPNTRGVPLGADPLPLPAADDPLFLDDATETRDSADYINGGWRLHLPEYQTPSREQLAAVLARPGCGLRSLRSTVGTAVGRGVLLAPLFRALSPASPLQEVHAEGGAFLFGELNTKYLAEAILEGRVGGLRTLSLPGDVSHLGEFGCAAAAAAVPRRRAHVAALKGGACAARGDRPEDVLFPAPPVGPPQGAPLRVPRRPGRAADGAHRRRRRLRRAHPQDQLRPAVGPGARPRAAAQLDAALAHNVGHEPGRRARRDDAPVRAPARLLRAHLAPPHLRRPQRVRVGRFWGVPARRGEAGGARHSQPQRGDAQLLSRGLRPAEAARGLPRAANRRGHGGGGGGGGAAPAGAGTGGLRGERQRRAGGQPAPTRCQNAPLPAPRCAAPESRALLPPPVLQVSVHSALTSTSALMCLLPQIGAHHLAKALLSPAKIPLEQLDISHNFVQGEGGACTAALCPSPAGRTLQHAVRRLLCQGWGHEVAALSHVPGACVRSSPRLLPRRSLARVLQPWRWGTR